ncbi:MAG: TlpA family protein disulfide reductase [Planctomycetes bacterium]|nr:TlpA family protein disulfide reductase [Planctomycetota bacterium]
MSTAKLLLLATAGLGVPPALSAPALASPAPQALTPMEVEAAMNSALAKVGPVRYRTKYTVLADDFSQVLISEVTVGSATVLPDMPFSRRLQARMKAEGSLGITEASFDGERLLHQMPDQESVWEIRFKPGDGFPVLELWQAILPGLGDHGPLPWKDALRRLEPEVSHGEHPCWALAARLERRFEAQQEGEPDRSVLEAVVLIDQATSLPRKRMVTQTLWAGEAELSRFETSIELLGELVRLKEEPTDFLIEVPEGWELIDATPKAPALKIAVGETAPEWTLEDFSGKEHSLKELRGRVVLLDFWATWCGPCRQAMPTMQALHEEFFDKGLTVVGISLFEQEGGDPAGYFEKMGFNYLGLCKGEAAGKAYGVGGIPHLVVIDREGRVAYQQVGFGPGETEELKSLIARLVNE